jgi:hypothetical protein
MTEPSAETDEMAAVNVPATMASIERMVMVGAAFAIVGYLLIGMALFFELTQFHPAIEGFVATYTDHSLAGGGPNRAGVAGVGSALATIHQWPSLLLWLKLGGVGHILVGIFVALAAIVRTLSLVPVRLGRELTRVDSAAASPTDDALPADD